MTPAEIKSLLITVWAEYLVWFKAEREKDQEYTDDPAGTPRPDVLKRPTFENFMEWLGEADLTAYADEVHQGKKDTKDYDKKAVADTDEEDISP